MWSSARALISCIRVRARASAEVISPEASCSGLGKLSSSDLSFSATERWCSVKKASKGGAVRSEVGRGVGHDGTTASDVASARSLLSAISPAWSNSVGCWMSPVR